MNYARNKIKIMSKEIESVGKCLYCNEIVDSLEIKKHLEKHLKAKEKESKNNATENYCYVEVESENYFLQLLVKGDAKMKVIDTFLKKIWLDCCGHLSGFSHRQYKVSKSHSVEDVFQPRVKIGYEYDYGSTTYLELKAGKQFMLPTQKKDVVLLSRNEPLPLGCDICHKKVATSLCSCCLWEDESHFCDNCKEKHGEHCSDYLDWAEMPIVNSPRMGVCGYEGGTIDKERDGIYGK